ncbi:MAG: RluA family pseudouridine synthase [Bdellovibrionota bacterium]
MPAASIFRIVHHEKPFLLIEKLKPFLSQRAKSSDLEDFHGFIGRQLGESLWPVHRLDREVLGLMLFARSKEFCEELTGQFRSRKVRKSYSAWVSGRPPKAKDRLVHYLKKNEKTNYTSVFPRPTPGAKEAVLSYEVQEERGDKTRLRIDLETGRSHQIRAQLAKIGCPILGDSRYGKSLKEAFATMPIQLKSCRLGFYLYGGSYFEWNLPPIEILEK